MSTSPQRHHPRPHHPHVPSAPHPLLPPDAHIGHDAHVLEIIQSYQDQIPQGTEGHGEVVIGYAAGPNPSVNGDFVGGTPRPHWAVYWWCAASTDAPLTVAGFDYIIERINEGKSTWND
jgi:hypothetical protein